MKEEEVLTVRQGKEPIALTVQRERGNNRDKEVVARELHLVSTGGGRG